MIGLWRQWFAASLVAGCASGGAEGNDARVSDSTAGDSGAASTPAAELDGSRMPTAPELQPEGEATGGSSGANAPVGGAAATPAPNQAPTGGAGASSGGQGGRGAEPEGSGASDGGNTAGSSGGDSGSEGGNSASGGNSGGGAANPAVAGAPPVGDPPSTVEDCFSSTGYPECTPTEFCEVDPQGAIGADWMLTNVEGGEEPVQHSIHRLLIPSADILAGVTKDHQVQGHVATVTATDLETLTSTGEVLISAVTQSCGPSLTLGEGNTICHQHEVVVRFCGE